MSDCLHRGFDDGHQQFLFAARAVRLRFDDDLVSGIDGGHAGVALYHALARRHLGRFVVGAVALADRAFAALAIFRVIVEPLPDLRGIGLQAGDALGFFGVAGRVRLARSSASRWRSSMVLAAASSLLA